MFMCMIVRGTPERVLSEYNEDLIFFWFDCSWDCSSLYADNVSDILYTYTCSIYLSRYTSTRRQRRSLA